MTARSLFSRRPFLACSRNAHAITTIILLRCLFIIFFFFHNYLGEIMHAVSFAPTTFCRIVPCWPEIVCEIPPLIVNRWPDEWKCRVDPEPPRISGVTRHPISVRNRTNHNNNGSNNNNKPDDTVTVSPTTFVLPLFSSRVDVPFGHQLRRPGRNTLVRTKPPEFYAPKLSGRTHFKIRIRRRRRTFTRT